MKRNKLLLSVLPILGGASLSFGLAVGLSNNAGTKQISAQTSTKASTTSQSGATFKIVSQTGDTTVNYGQSLVNIQTYIQKANSNDRLKYEWQRDIGNGFVTIQAGFSPTNQKGFSSILPISVPKVVTATTYRYRLVVVNVNNSKDTLQSREINVTFLPQSTSYVSVRTQPSDQTVKSGDNVTLSVSATTTGGATLGYQWFEDKDNTGNFTKIDGANSSTYSFVANNRGSSNIQSRYICKFFVNGNTSQYLNVSNVAIVTTTPSNENPIIPDNNQNSNITIKNESQTVSEVTKGSTWSARFSLDATSKSNEQLYIDWYVDNGSGFELKQAGAQNYFVLNSNSFPNGISSNIKVYAVVHNQDKTQSTKSKEFVLNVKDSTSSINPSDKNSTITITSETQDKNYIRLGTSDSILLTVNATSSKNETLHYDWYVDKGDGKFALYQQSTNNFLRLNSNSFPGVTVGTTVKVHAIVRSQNNLQTVQSKDFAINIKANNGTNNNQNSSITIDSQTQSQTSVDKNSNWNVLFSINAKEKNNKPLNIKWYVDKGDGRNVMVQGGAWNYLRLNQNSFTKGSLGSELKVYATATTLDGKNSAKSQVFTLKLTDSSKRVNSNIQNNSSNLSNITQSSTVTNQVNTTTNKNSSNEKKEPITIDNLTGDVVKKVGSNANLTVNASIKNNNSASLSYQWFKAKNDGSWDRIDNATSSTYNVSVTNGTSIYMVQVKSSDDIVQTKNISVTGIEKDVDSSKTINVKVESNQNVSVLDKNGNLLTKINKDWFCLNISNNTSNLKFQWFYTVGSSTTATSINGATNKDFTPSNELLKTILGSGGKAKLYCAISDENGTLLKTVSNPSLYISVYQAK